MRHQLLKGLVIVLLLSFITSVAAAQDDTEAVSLEEQAAAVLEEAQNLTDFAFNLLGIFEVVGVAITIMGVALGYTAIGRLASAENSLTQAREEVESEIQKIREQFNADLERRKEEFAALSGQLQRNVDEQRREAANATLATALIAFGERQYRASDFKGAADTYHRALALDSNNPVTYYRLAYVHLSSGELDVAEENLKQSLSIDSEFAPAKAALGFVYRRKGEKMDDGIARDRMFNMAERWMLDGLEASPKLIDEDGESWWGALGGLYKKRGQIEQAIKAYEQAATVTPNSSYPFGNLAQLYGKRNNIDEMLKRYARVERLAKAEVQAEVGNYWGYFDVLTSHLALGHIEAADDIFESVVETVPPDAVYAFDMLVSTLRGLADTLKDYPQSKDLLIFANRVADYKRKREESGGDPNDTMLVETISNSSSDAPA